MDEKSMIDDLVSQLDAGFSADKAVGHFNVDVSEGASKIGRASCRERVS